MSRGLLASAWRFHPLTRVTGLETQATACLRRIPTRDHRQAGLAAANTPVRITGVGVATSISGDVSVSEGWPDVGFQACAMHQDPAGGGKKPERAGGRHEGQGAHAATDPGTAPGIRSASQRHRASRSATEPGGPNQRPLVGLVVAGAGILRWQIDDRRRPRCAWRESLDR